MSGENWTPGPWARWPFTENEGIRIGTRLAASDPNFYHIGFVTDVNGDPKNEANANLIAAAPDLYEALKVMMHEADASFWPQEMDAMQLGYAALAKARGEDT